MEMINVKHLTKEFNVYSSRSGLLGAFRDLFTRNYKTVAAVNRISLNVQKGEMVGYIGENGAGKSTTIKMLTGILTPTAGEIRINGMDPHQQREQYVRTIGVVFGQRSQLWWDIAVQESFRLLKKVYRVSDADYAEHMEHVIDTLDIGPLLDKPVRKLSLGQRMRCELAAALIHNPPLLFLDEPTIGLDVLVKMKIREFLKEINAKYNTTVILTTHDLADIEALCERVVMLDQGSIIYDGSLEQLRSNWVEGKQIVFTFDQILSANELTEATLDLDVHWQNGDNELDWVARVAEREQADVINRVSARFSIQDMKIVQVSTEEIVRNIYEQGIQVSQQANTANPTTKTVQDNRSASSVQDSRAVSSTQDNEAAASVDPASKEGLPHG